MTLDTQSLDMVDNFSNPGDSIGARWSAFDNDIIIKGQEWIL